MSGRVVEVLFGFDPGLVRQPPLLLTTFPAQRTAWCGCISSRGGLVTTSTMQLHLPLSPTLVLPRGLALTDNAAATGRIQGFFEQLVELENPNRLDTRPGIWWYIPRRTNRVWWAR